MQVLYDIFIVLLNQEICFFSYFNNKSKLIYEGRKNTFVLIKQTIKKTDKVIWFHCSSLGEYEQGKPLIEELKKKIQVIRLLCLFFPRRVMRWSLKTL